MDDIENLHKEAYEAEREYRWEMAKKYELPAAEYILNNINKILSITNPLQPIRYDNIWFKEHPVDQNEWVKGTPDFVLPIQIGNESKFFKTEIKIKDAEYRKTVNGGTTRGNSIIPKYGCTSFYLDVEPVYRNMIDFCNYANIPYSKFIIAFISGDYSSCNLITLENIQNMIENGWNGVDIGIFSEGYGQPAYLIPKDATKTLNSFSKEELLNLSVDKVYLPV